MTTCMCLKRKNPTIPFLFSQFVGKCVTSLKLGEESYEAKLMFKMSSQFSHYKHFSSELYAGIFTHCVIFSVYKTTSP